MSHSSDDDEATSQDGQELMFGLDFSSLKVADIQEEKNSNVNVTTNVIKSVSYDPALVETLLLFEDTLPPATESDFTVLFEWVTKQGAQLDGICCQKDDYGGRGLYATRSVPKGGTLAMLPRSLRIGQSDACQKLGLPLDTPDLTALSLLILWFCREGHIIARCLPRQAEFTNAMLMSPLAQLSWSKSPEYSSAIRRIQSTGEACQNYIYDYLASTTSPPKTTNNTTLYWAISMVKSRSHAFGSKRGYWLTPVFDLVNHSPNPNAVLEGDDHGRLVRVVYETWDSVNLNDTRTRSSYSLLTCVLYRYSKRWKIFIKEKKLQLIIK
jgi:hypothetical protein